MEVGADNRIALFAESFLGECMEQVTVVPLRVSFCVIPFAAAGHVSGQTEDCRGRDKGKDSFRGSIVQKEPEKPGPVITGVDLVSVAEKAFPAVQIQDRGAGKDGCSDGFREVNSHVKVMVPLKIDDAGSGVREPPQLLQYGQVVGEKGGPVADPELEQVPEDEQRFRRAVQFGKESRKGPVIFIIGIPQVSIGNEYLSHCRTITKMR